MPSLRGHGGLDHGHPCCDCHRQVSGRVSLGGSQQGGQIESVKLVKLWLAFLNMLCAVDTECLCPRKSLGLNPSVSALGGGPLGGDGS